MRISAGTTVLGGPVRMTDPTTTSGLLPRQVTNTVAYAPPGTPSNNLERVDRRLCVGGGTGQKVSDKCHRSTTDGFEHWRTVKIGGAVRTPRTYLPIMPSSWGGWSESTDTGPYRTSWDLGERCMIKCMTCG